MIWGSSPFYIIVSIVLVSLVALEGRRRARRARTEYNATFILLLSIVALIMGSVNLYVGVTQRSPLGVPFAAVGIAFGIVYSIINTILLIRQVLT